MTDLAASQERSRRIFGRSLPPPRPIALQSGPVSALLDGPDLRHVRRPPSARGHRLRLDRPAERFIRTLMDEWAYARPYRATGERLHALRRYVDFYNRGRPHTALRGLVPQAAVDDVHEQHI